MGCFNLYCLLCSMPSWYNNNNFDKYWFEEINEIRRKNKKKK